MKKTDKKLFFLILVILALIVLAVFLFRYFSEKSAESVDTVTTDEEDEIMEDYLYPYGEENSPEFTVKATKESVNAYDYILSIMNEPQYWSAEEYVPPYSAPWYTEEAMETLVNGTGWYLKDEETATFERGYLSKFSINFSKHLAICVDELSSETYYLDYENDVYYHMTGDYRSDITRINKLKGSDWYWQSPYGMIDATFRYYEAIFEAAGCPLLNEEEGTLSSYKNKKAKKVTVIDDGLIHAPWEQEGFTFAWEEHADELEWLTDYRDILDKPAPESEYQTGRVCDINNECTDIEYKKYSPRYLVLANIGGSEKFTKQDGSYWFESTMDYDNITEALATYYLAPAMETVYGYPAVYFVDNSTLNGPNHVMLIYSDQDFQEGIYCDYSYTVILEAIDDKSDEIYSGCGYTVNFNNPDFLMLFGNVREIYDYYGKDYPYGDDYLGNFMLVYSIEEQLMLGLR